MKDHEIKLDGLSVCIGIPSSRDFNPYVVKSLFQTRDLCGNLGVPCSLAIIAGNAVIQWARDEVLSFCLKSSANRFFLIDSDIVWEPEDFMRLLALSTKRDVVCASYPAKKDDLTFYIRHDGNLVADEFGLVEIRGAGLGFTVVNRSVIEEVCNASKQIYDEIAETSHASVFKVGTYKGNRRGEDMAFFDTLLEMGHKVYLDPSISLGHIGTKIYRGKPLDAMVTNES